MLVGHYLGDTIVNAEAVLDRQLDGALSRRLDLGVYPGSSGQHALFFNKWPSVKPRVAIVVSLGQVGELTSALREVRAGSAAISCLPVGTGADGMTVRDALEAILRGAIAANRRLVDTQMDEQVTIDKIEFIELYEHVAIAACEALQALLRDGQLASAVRASPSQPESGSQARDQLAILLQRIPQPRREAWLARADVAPRSASPRARPRSG